VWEQIGAASTPPDVCGIRPAISPTDPNQVIFYLQARKPGTGAGACWQWTHLGNACNQGASDNVGDGLYKYEGIGTAGQWQRIDTNPIYTAAGTLDPDSGGIASSAWTRQRQPPLCLETCAPGPRPAMIYSIDGGATWREDPISTAG